MVGPLIVMSRPGEGPWTWELTPAHCGRLWKRAKMSFPLYVPWDTNRWAKQKEVWLLSALEDIIPFPSRTCCQLAVIPLGLGVFPLWLLLISFSSLFLQFHYDVWGIDLFLFILFSIGGNFWYKNSRLNFFFLILKTDDFHQFLAILSLQIWLLCHFFYSHLGSSYQTKVDTFQIVLTLS